MNYDIRTDIDNQEDPFELMFNDGDFQIYQSDEQIVRLTLLSGKGNWKQEPLIGAELINLLHQSSRNDYSNIVATELEKVGYKLISFSPGETLGDYNLDVEEL